MQIRDRIKEFKRVRAGTLKPHPKNWRAHPEAQRNALMGILSEIGYSDALLTRRLDDGSLQLIDGHLRAETTPEMDVPVLILDLDDQETDKLLALHDPLAELAETNQEMLTSLTDGFETQNESLQKLLDGMLNEDTATVDLESDQSIRPEVDIPEAFQVVVECADEGQQQTLYERLGAEGFKCRLLTL